MNAQARADKQEFYPLLTYKGYVGLQKKFKGL
jgi:hypothetical protein